MAAQQKIRAVFMRGGTSKALMFRADDLPKDRKDWTPIFTAAMGSPDENGRQLNGMGGGLSSLSKVCIVGPSSRPDADVDYTFGQVAIREAAVDYAGNCGNMSSAIGPFAVQEGLVSAPADGETAVRIHNTNTGKIIVAHFEMKDGEPVVAGTFQVDGVGGGGAPVRLDFVDPGGAKTGTLLPTQSPVDRIPVNGRSVSASMIDAANPCVFVKAEELGRTGTELPADLDNDAELLENLEQIRREASVRMGITADIAAAAKIKSIPKIAILSQPKNHKTISGAELADDQCDIVIRMISEGQPHRATPITGALCLAAACRVEGSVAHTLLKQGQDAPIRIGHPSGVVTVDAKVSKVDGATKIESASVYRTARRLFEGQVFYVPEA